MKTTAAFHAVSAACQSIPCFKTALLLALLFLLGCAEHSEIRKEMRLEVKNGQYVRAMKSLKKVADKSSSKDRLMDLMDKGLILHLLGEYEKSNEAFMRAKRKIDELFARSISEEIGSIAWNDKTKSFEGEEFEKIMVNMMMAFNYLHLDKLEEAAVEARQINHRLQQYADKLAQAKIRISYRQDPFAQFLAGMIHEAMDDANDAFRSYENALEGYEKLTRSMGVRPSRYLKISLLRSARALGYKEKIRQYEARFRDSKAATPEFWRDKGRIVVITAVGEIAHKTTEKWMIPDPQGDIIAVTYPVFKRARSNITHTKAAIGEDEKQGIMVHDLSTLAINQLNDKNKQIKGRAVARAMLRYAGKKVARVAANSKNKTAKALGILSNIALNVADVVETADTRSWMTLPDHLRLNVFAVTPGKHRVMVEFRGRGDYVIDRQRFNLDVKAGETKFIYARGRERQMGRPDPYAKPIDDVRLPEDAPRKRPGKPVSLLSIESDQR